MNKQTVLVTDYVFADFGDTYIRFAEPVLLSKSPAGVMPATTLRNLP